MMNEMFLKFCCDEERQKYGGSCFIEIQYCRMPIKSSIKEIVGAEISHWDYSSLFVFYEGDEFYYSYCDIFGKGVYANLEEGLIDLYGINYFSSQKVDNIIDRIKAKKPSGYEVLLQWLENGLEYNGIYVLGV